MSTAQARLDVAKGELARQQALLAVVRTRQSTGFATGLDVAQQDTQVTAAAAAVPPYQAQIDAQRHALVDGQLPDDLNGDEAAEVFAGLAPLPGAPTACEVPGVGAGDAVAAGVCVALGVGVAARVGVSADIMPGTDACPTDGCGPGD